jgi:hypothetical protein
MARSRASLLTVLDLREIRIRLQPDRRPAGTYCAGSRRPDTEARHDIDRNPAALDSADGSRRLHGDRAIGMQRFGRPQARSRPFRQQACGPGARGHRVARARIQLDRGAGAVRHSDRHADCGCGCGPFDDADAGAVADPRGQAGAVADARGQAGAEPVTRPGAVAYALGQGGA